MSVSKKRMDKLRVQAKIEIGEVDDKIPRLIDELKDILSEDNSLNLHPSVYDELYLQCIRASKYDINRAAKLYKNFCKLRHSGIQGVKEISLPSIQERIFRVKMLSMLAPRDHLGRQILYIQIPNWDPKKIRIESIFASLLLLLDEGLTSIDTQLHGFILLVDSSGFSWSMARQIGLSHLQAFFKALQGSYPARFKAIHIVHNHALVDMILTAAKQFMKEKIRDRIFCHGSNLDSLHKYMDPAVLPESMGGKLSESDCDDKSLVNSLMQKDGYYRDFLQYGYTS